MLGNLVIVVFLFAYIATANPADTSKKKKIGFLPRIRGGAWDKKKGTTVVRQIMEPDGPIKPFPSEDDILSWFKLLTNIHALGSTTIAVQTHIAHYISSKTFPLSLIKRIQKAIGISSPASFSRMLNSFHVDILGRFIELSPCAYERLLSLSNYKMLNLEAIATAVDYLRKAPQKDICTSKLWKHLQIHFRTHYKMRLRYHDILNMGQDEILKKPISDILEVLQSDTLYALHLPEAIHEFGTHVLENGNDDQKFKVMSLNLCPFDLLVDEGQVILMRYLDGADEIHAAYGGPVPPFVDDPRVAESDKDSIYSAKILAWRNHNWGYMGGAVLLRHPLKHLKLLSLLNERWKHSFYQMKTEKKSGMVTLLTLEYDYNSIVMGTATPEVTEAFCKNAKALPDQTVKFWNTKFIRSIKVKDALPGVCFEKGLEVKRALYALRLAGVYNRSITCSVYDLVKKLPEFSWYISTRELPPVVFEDLFECGFTFEALIELNEDILILGESHGSLAIAIGEQLIDYGVADITNSPYPLINEFLMINYEAISST